MESAGSIDWKFVTEVLLCVGTLLLALFTLFLWKETKRIADDAKTASENNLKEADRASSAAERSATASENSADTAKKIHENQKQLAQRQFIVPLWQQTSTLPNIDSENPKTDDVVKAVNVLELVAVCMEGGMVDSVIMRRVFAENYLRLYRQISKCKKIPRLETDGDELLNQCPAVKQLFKELEEEADNKHKPTALG